MHLILLHGYLLSGTGSNIYVANVAKAWKKQGHAVTVVCQDPGARTLPFVDEYIDSGDALPASPPNPGRISRSPGRVIRMFQITSRTLSMSAAQARRPSASGPPRGQLRICCWSRFICFPRCAGR